MLVYALKSMTAWTRQRPVAGTSVFCLLRDFIRIPHGMRYHHNEILIRSAVGKFIDAYFGYYEIQSNVLRATLVQSRNREKITT